LGWCGLCDRVANKPPVDPFGKG